MSHTTVQGGRTKWLVVGIAGILLTLAGLLLPDNSHAVALGWLVGVGFWTAIAIGMLLLVMIHHVFDAGWSVIFRRQFEHGIAVFPWLFVLFIPLLVATWLVPGSVWNWTDPHQLLHAGETIGEDVLYQKKAAFLNPTTLTFFSVLFFLIWSLMAAGLRKASFRQDADGDPKWTRMSRKISAAGIVITALTLTAASIYWFKSLEYHWFSTMYGVWFFANCIRGALSVGVLIALWLYARGDFKGILNDHHMWLIGQLVFAFTVFWGYITFSQYFLIWGANVPEETFWYNIRELNLDGSTNQWWYVGLVLVFGHFLFPFLYLLSYKNKLIHKRIKFIVYWILGTILVDMCYNILPALKDAHGDAQPFLSMNLVWVLTAVIGVGGVFIWVYLNSFASTKLIPIRDPRIRESLEHHE